MQYEICKCCGKPKRPKPQNQRFPSHLLLTHTPSCIQVGTKRVRGTAPRGEPSAWQPKAVQNGTTYSLPNNASGGSLYTDEDGMETVTAWECPDFCPVRVLDAQGGLRKSGGGIKAKAGSSIGFLRGEDAYHFKHDNPTIHEPTEGFVSRYFQQLPALDDIPPYIYAGKASRRDRNEGLEDLPEKQGTHTVYLNNRRCRNCDKQQIGRSPCQCPSPDWEIIPRSNNAQNTHPTVKSQPLMRYLTRMICPPNGIVLDCFAGSGSTLVAAIHEGFHFIGIEKEEEYVEIARKRIQHAISASGTQQPNMPLAPSVPTTVRKPHDTPHSSQLSLWDMEGEAV